MVFTAIIQNVHGTKLADRDSPDTVYHITSRLRTSAPPLVSAFLCWSFPFVWLPFSPSLPPSLLLLAFSLLFHLFHPDLPSFLPVIDRANNTSAVFWPIALKPPHSPVLFRASAGSHCLTQFTGTHQRLQYSFKRTILLPLLVFVCVVLLL